MFSKLTYIRSLFVLLTVLGVQSVSAAETDVVTKKKCSVCMMNCVKMEKKVTQERDAAGPSDPLHVCQNYCKRECN